MGGEDRNESPKAFPNFLNKLAVTLDKSSDLDGQQGLMSNTAHVSPFLPTEILPVS